MLIHVRATALASQARPIMLILGHRADELRSQVATHLQQQHISIIENPNYQQGMSTSLHMGLHALTNIRDNNRQSVDLPTSTVILLGDQPLMTASIIDRLIATRETSGKSIIVPLYHGKRGNPVLFAADLFPELMTVTGDEGGRSVIMRHPQDIATVEVSEATASSDIDTWEAYQQVVAKWQHTQQ